MQEGQAVAACTRYLKEVECRAAGRDGDAAVFKSDPAQQPAIAVPLAEAQGKTSQLWRAYTVPFSKATQMVSGPAHARE